MKIEEFSTFLRVKDQETAAVLRLLQENGALDTGGLDGWVVWDDSP